MGQVGSESGTTGAWPWKSPGRCSVRIHGSSQSEDDSAVFESATIPPACQRQFSGYHFSCPMNCMSWLQAHLFLSWYAALPLIRRKCCITCPSGSTAPYRWVWYGDRQTETLESSERISTRSCKERFMITFGKQNDCGSLTLRERQFLEEYGLLLKAYGKDAVILRENKSKPRKKKAALGSSKDSEWSDWIW